MGITLGAIADLLDVPAAAEFRDVRIDDVHHDSRDVVHGTLFVAIDGEHVDGHRFVAAAETAGASAVLAEKTVSTGIPLLVVADSRRAMAGVARAVHGSPDERLSIVGVTGTNGKTTVVHMCEAIWRSVSRRHGIIGTLGARHDGVPVGLERTTPESSDLQRLLGRMADDGIRSVAMEVSSHALDLHRADAIRFTAVGFTNLTQDHLDFHGTMDAYLASKQQLFEAHRADRAVIDIGTDAGRATADVTPLPTTTVAVEHDADISAVDLHPTASGTAFTVRVGDVARPAHLPLVGRFNVANALVALGLTIADDVPAEDAIAGLDTLTPVRGRMEVVPGADPATVIVDYAHTPDAVGAVLDAIGDMGFDRSIVVVGAGGDRDRGKRHDMGFRAASGADIVIVTNDNPRTESPVEIARSIRDGALAAGRAEVRVVLDRRDAITVAIGEAGDGDVVLILGKGHEQGQDIDGTVYPFDDRTVAREAIEESQ